MPVDSYWLTVRCVVTRSICGQWVARWVQGGENDVKEFGHPSMITPGQRDLSLNDQKSESGHHGHLACDWQVAPALDTVLLLWQIGLQQTFGAPLNFKLRFLVEGRDEMAQATCGKT